MVTPNIKREKSSRIHPSAALEIRVGNRGVAHVSIVATVSIDDAMFGTEEMQSAKTIKTRETLCQGGLALGNAGLLILMG
mmetsp:Transcript_15044/g.19053  ORF Transcript_15044/g.19053 Transcript_15044/m.19053 type:complete len:80 (+) Transcript_15044:855-1094(+)